MATIIITKQNVYEQIASKYRQLIDLGILTEGEALPSCRDIAKELGVNPNTVNKAFTMLESDGYIEIWPKKGAFVKRVKKEKENQTLNEVKNLLIKYRYDVAKNEMIKLLDEIYDFEKGGNNNDSIN